MWEIVSKNGVHTELMVCEKEGHGQSSLISHLGVNCKTKIVVTVYRV